MEKRSLTPYGRVWPRLRIRLQASGRGWVNEEAVIAHLWEQWNQLDAPVLPVQEILHRILPGMAAGNRLNTGDFVKRGFPYMRRELHLLSGVIQFLGTNGGREFRMRDLSSRPGYHPSRRFLLNLELEREWGTDMEAFFAHQCTDRCKKPFAECVYISEEVSPRDRAIVRACMFWLGQKDGQRFLKEFEDLVAKARERENRRRCAALGLQKAA